MSITNKLNQTNAQKFNTGKKNSLIHGKNITFHNGVTIYNEANAYLEKHEISINLTISSPISGVMLMLLLLSLRASDVDAPSDL